MVSDEATVNYVVRLPTTDERREAASLLRSDLLAAVRALAGCQRCGFVEQVLAAFNPELAAAIRPASVIGGGAGIWRPTAPPETARTDAECDPHNGLQRSFRDLAYQPSQPSSDSPTNANTCDLTADATATAASSLAMPSACVMAPMQVLALLSDRGGSSDLVGLLQFAWKGSGGSSSRGHDGGGGSGGDGAGGGGGSDGRLGLGESLISRPRLLRRFLEESVAVMQALSDDVGDCRRHSGYPGPVELASTLARLETQRCHTLQRLAAWGVLRSPPQPSRPLSTLPTPVGLVPSAAPGPGELALVAARDLRAPELRAEAYSEGRGYSVGDAEAEAWEQEPDPEGDDPHLALAIQLSLRDPGGLVGGAASPSPLVPVRLPPLSSPADSTSGDVPGQGSSRLQPQQAPQAPRRPQRTPPRPTAVSPAGAGTASGGGQLRGHIGAPLMSSLRGSGALGSARLVRSPSGLADRSPTGGGTGASAGARRSAAAVAAARPLGMAAALEPAAESPMPISMHPEEDASSPPRRRQTDQGPLPSPSRPLWTPLTSTAVAGQEPSSATAAGAVASLEHQAVELRAHAASGVLCSVAGAVAAAEGLPDATVLVDAAAVAALSEGLRERVQHLVAQLVQVQQRRSRLVHACQHGILAGGRKLLLIMLQLLWASVRRAAATATAAAATVPGSAASPPAAAAVGAAPEPPTEAALTSSEAATESSPAVPGAATALQPQSQPQPSLAAAQQPGAVLGVRSPALSPHQSTPPGRRRVPRYEGLLADLAAGLEGEDAYLYLDLEVGPCLDLEADLGLDLEAVAAAEMEAQADMGMELVGAGEWGISSAGLGPARTEELGSGLLEGGLVASRSWRSGAGASVSASASAGHPGHRHQAHRGAAGVSELPHRASGGVGDARQDSAGGDDGGEGWDAALALTGAGVGGRHGGDWGRSGRASVSTSSLGALALLRRSAAPPSSFALGRQPAAPSVQSAEGVAAVHRLAAGPAGLQAPIGESTGGWAAVDGCAGGGSCWLGSDMCQPGCLAAREQQQQAEQLRNLQGQLLRCQTSQTELQAEVGRLLDLLAEQRRLQEQATAALRRDLAQWQAEPGALQGLGAEELGELATKMEAALSRVRSAQLQAAADRDLMCPVCWERRKGLVFGCGHQTCCACGERLAACPICREPVSLRIRVYG